MNIGIKQYLTPKSEKEIRKEIQKMSAFEFIFLIQHNSINPKIIENVRIGLWKRIVLAIVCNKNFFIVITSLMVLASFIVNLKFINIIYRFIIYGSIMSLYFGIIFVSISYSTYRTKRYTRIMKDSVQRFINRERE